MKRFLTIRVLLTGLALLGLVLSPMARPATASGAVAQGDMAMHATMDMADMPCCPDDAAKPDCAKDCPLMAMCMAKTFQSNPPAVDPLVSLGRARSVALSNDANRDGFAQAPLPRPPDV